MTAATANRSRVLDGALSFSTNGVPGRIMGTMGHCHFSDGAGPRGKSGEAGEPALREVVELLDRCWKEEDAVFADDSASAGRGAGYLADDPQRELAPSLLSPRTENGSVVAIVEAMCEFATRHEVRPQPATAERETVERSDADGERDLPRAARPDLVAGGPELLQVGVAPGDENAAIHTVVVRRQRQPHDIDGFAIPAKVLLQGCVDSSGKIRDLSAAEVLAGHVLVTAEVDITAQVRHCVHKIRITSTEKIDM